MGRTYPVEVRYRPLLADGEQAAGQVSAVVQEEFGISQPAVSQPQPQATGIQTRFVVPAV